MTKRMLIDASQPEETRLVVLDGNRIEEFDVEAADRLPLKGNIYLAKVVRVEPSLQAAFVEYGGNRHGFLAFGEIHPDYYQIPVADRQRLLEMQAQEAEEEEDAELDTAAERLAPADDRDLTAGDDRGPRADDDRGPRADADGASPADRGHGAAPDEAYGVTAAGGHDGSAEASDAGGAPADDAVPDPVPAPDPVPVYDSLTGSSVAEAAPVLSPAAPAAPVPHQVFGEPAPETPPETLPRRPRAQPMSMHVDQVAEGERAPRGSLREAEGDPAEELPPPETIGGDSDGGAEEAEERGQDRRIPSRLLRHYKIQEVIRRRQIMLVQVVKEERGNKGAALTTYISLAGRFSVLMPNSPRGGGVSRKITQVADRKRLREAVEEMRLPKGMSIIVRTAGAQRPKPEIRRDGDYLLRLWDDIRERTMASTAPALVYEEADLIKRSLRDSYGRDIEDVEVEGEDAWKQARDFMRMIMPTHEKRVRLYRDPSMPLFARAGVEQQLDAMMSPVVQLKSGGYIVINQTEALVAIDVNSGRATRDRHIEDTALRTNCEAADEIGRQLRLRDLAGLIVIDFIDMESSRNDAMVERRLKESLRLDRARIQLGRISHFGLLEMSRQRLRPSLTEHAFATCAHCQGRGIVRSLESSALHVLRAIEEEGAKRRAAEVVVRAAEPVALHILNRKRDRLQGIEARHAMAVLLLPDREMSETNLRIERTRPYSAAPATLAPGRAPALRMDYAPEAEFEAEAPPPAIARPLPAASPAAQMEPPPARPAAGGPRQAAAAAPSVEPAMAPPAGPAAEGTAEGRAAEGRRRRRRRRGGRREEGGLLANGQARPEGSPEGLEDEEENAAAAPGEDDAPDLAADTAMAGQEEPEGSAPAGGESRWTAPGEGEAAGFGDEARGRRRGRRGGRRRQEDVTPMAGVAEPAPPPPATPRYAGPTPADPFAGTYDDIYDAMAAAEAAAEAAARRLSPGDPPAEVIARVSPSPDAEGSPVTVAVAVAVAVVPEAAKVSPMPETAEASPLPEAASPPQAAGASSLEVAEASPTPEVAEPRPPVAESGTPPAAAPPLSPAAAAPAGPAAMPDDAARRGVGPDDVSDASGTALAAMPASPVAATPAAPAPEEPVAGPAVRPVVLDGAPEPGAPRRRGWWKS